MKKAEKVVNIYGKEQILFNDGSGKIQSVRLNKHVKVPTVLLANKTWVQNETNRILWLRNENEEYKNYSLVTKQFHDKYLSGSLDAWYLNKNNKQ
jgi:hypothetical protein